MARRAARNRGCQCRGRDLLNTAERRLSPGAADDTDAGTWHDFLYSTRRSRFPRVPARPRQPGTLGRPDVPRHRAFKLLAVDDASAAGCGASGAHPVLRRTRGESGVHVRPGSVVHANARGPVSSVRSQRATGCNLLRKQHRQRLCRSRLPALRHPGVAPERSLRYRDAGVDLSAARYQCGRDRQRGTDCPAVGSALDPGTRFQGVPHR